MKSNIGERLRLLRKSMGYTTQELADKVVVSQSYISQFENNKAIPDIEMLNRILTALDSNLSSFFSSDLEDASEDLIELISTIKKLTPDARIKLNEFLKVIKDN